MPGIQSRSSASADSLLAKWRGSGLARGASLMTGAEMGNRVTRIVTGIILARCFTTIEFGVIALVLTTYELVRTLIHNGFGARIMQASDDEIDEVCAAVHRLNWVVGALMCAAQAAIAWPISRWFDTDVTNLLLVLGATHLIYPIALVRACVAQRDNRMGFVAGMSFFQISLDNALTSAMALAGFGLWAAVAPKIIVAILWTALTLWLVAPRPRAHVGAGKIWNVVAYGRRVLAAESLNTFRANADRFIVGYFLGMQANGIYAFAVNNGSGVATGISSAIGQAVLPYLARGQRDEDNLKRRFWRSAKLMSIVVMPLVLLQVALAPWYVPLIFGEKWLPAVPAVMLMCLGTLSRPIIVATAQLLRATGDAELEWRISLANAVLFAAALCGGMPHGVEGVASALAVVNIVPAMIFAKVALDRASGMAAPASDAEFAEAAA